MRQSVVAVLGILIVAFALAPLAAADGNEILNPPLAPFELQGGSNIVAAGVGLGVSQPQTIEISVPAGEVKQVILYWEGRGLDATITVNGSSVTGTSIGESGAVVPASTRHTVRADITGLGLVVAGAANFLTIDDVDLDLVDGAGVLVIYSDTTQTISDVQLVDGGDYAYTGVPDQAAHPELCCTVKKTFNFAPRSFDRSATLAAFFGDVQGPLSGGASQRPNTVEVEISDGVTTNSLAFVNELASLDGPEWDTFVKSIPVPAGFNSVSIQAFSDDRASTGNDPSSLVWIASGFAVPEACLGRMGDFVWQDTNGNGIQDPGEPGIPDVELTLTLPDNSTVTTTTDASGFYEFGGLCAGTYTVAVTSGVPAGLNPTLPFQGDPATDSNTSPASVILTADDSEDLTIDFGYVAPVTSTCNLVATKTATPDTIVKKDPPKCEPKKDSKYDYGHGSCTTSSQSSSATYVTYNYTVTNLGSDVVNLIGIDSRLGFVFPPQALAAGQTIQATRHEWISSTTTNTISITSQLAATGETCTAQASATVNVTSSGTSPSYTPPPPPPPQNGGTEYTFDSQEIKVQ